MLQPQRHHELLKRALGIKGPVTKPLPQEYPELEALLRSWCAGTSRSGAGEAEESEEEES